MWVQVPPRAPVLVLFSSHCNHFQLACPFCAQSNRLHQALDAVLTALVPFRVVPAIDSEMPSTSATSRMVPPLVRISVAIVSRNR